jgi:serine/threonine protein kinase
VVHFSGHGSQGEQLILMGSGQPRSVTKDALVDLFELLKDNLRVVVLNACHSKPQAEAIARVIDCAIGMNTAIGDEAAIVFSAAFYQALGFGCDVQTAFGLGRNALVLEGLLEEQTPELYHRKEAVDPSKVVLVAPVQRSATSNDEATRRNRDMSRKELSATQQKQGLDHWFSSSPNKLTGRLSGRLIPQVGQVIGQFQLREPIGSGGAGVVFRAIHIPTGKIVAFKLFYPLKAELQAVTKATERAVRGLANLNHPGIVPLVDFGYLNQRSKVSPYLVYEIVMGKPLDIWSREIAGRDGMVLRRFGIAVKIADALKSAHECSYIGNLGFREQGILHGDIKPQNILVRVADENPMILDFMIPDLQRLTAGQDHHTHWCKDENGAYWYDQPLTEVFGTPGYMSPEQAVEGIVSSASDVYSLGQTFLRLFWPTDCAAQSEDYDYDRYLIAARGSADRPETALAKLTAHMTADQLENHLQGISDALLRLRLETALAKLTAHMIASQPEDRPQGMAEVMERLRAIEQGTVASAEESTVTPARTSFAARVAEFIMKRLRRG